MTRKMVTQMSLKCLTKDEDIFLSVQFMATAGKLPVANTSRRNLMAQFGPISIYSQYLSGLKNQRGTDTSKRNEAHGEGMRACVRVCVRCLVCVCVCLVVDGVVNWCVAHVGRK